MNEYVILRENLKCVDHLKNVIMQGKIFNIFNCIMYQSALSPTYVLLDKKNSSFAKWQKTIAPNGTKEDSVGGFGVLSSQNKRYDLLLG